MNTNKKTKGRQKLEMKRVEDEAKREVTFSKRKKGLFNKASELCELCGVEVALILLSPHLKPFTFGHPKTRLYLHTTKSTKSCLHQLPDSLSLWEPKLKLFPSFSRLKAVSLESFVVVHLCMTALEVRGSMVSQRKNSPHTVSSESYKDQYFLLNFVMGTYLGPDVYSDNPRCSASQRLAEGLPPYSSKNMGYSFISISQLESLYYYVLRNAQPNLVVKPPVLHMYLKGDLPPPSSELPENCQQFTSFFPMNIHGHKKYSGDYEIVKGIVLIDDPNISYMKKEDLERFKCLSGMHILKIDRIKSLCYQHGKSLEEGEQNCMKNSEMAAGNISNGDNNSSARFQETYKRTRHRDPPPVPTFPNVDNHSGEGVVKKTCNRDGSVDMPLLTAPSSEEYMSATSITLTGTANKGIVGPPVGIVDIGVSEPAYFFRVALPGVRRDYCQFSCEIESDGKVHIQGSTSGGKTIRKRSRVFQMKFQQLCPAGPFTVSFRLPGPVDPRLFSPNFRSDGIFEGVVIKDK
ncbi:hypothetical protein LWI28_006078 [Acer negundo]|uniref:MADS-box domain-containing protein n=1 Tax=Acer negundo TaxID=4023 RepID=A0AAD5JVL1_ACENE|nr:hypothetical protein LWI28_006078 [Acer negundo]